MGHGSQTTLSVSAHAQNHTKWFLIGLHRWRAATVVTVVVTLSLDGEFIREIVCNVVAHERDSGCPINDGSTDDVSMFSVLEKI